MTIEQVISYIGILGLGGILGIVIKSIVDFKISKRQLMFEARKKAYAGLTGRIFSHFLEPDVTCFKEEALVWAKINQLLSEAFLLGSNKLVELIGEYKPKVNEYHKLLAKKNDEERSKILHRELTVLAGNIFDQMRKDLSISSKTVWEYPKNST
ncbi:hypothetical protein ES705_37783 [subsurface metagenome]